MGILKEEYVPIADALLTSLARDLNLFEAENHLYNASFLAAMQNKTNELRAKETGDALLTRQKKTTQELYTLGNDLTKPMKLLNVVFDKAGIKNSLPSDILKKVKKRNFEGVLLNLKALKEIVSSQATLLTSCGMKPNTETVLQNSFDTITAKSNEQSSYQQQRKAFTSTNKGLYKELYVYISEVARLGKIIFQGEQKASEYTIDSLIAMVNSSKKSKSGDEPQAKNV
ncbi:hypothetical protein [Chryseobacterium daeguense]|uniref:hypothetical protein n=1 Tax=Chryseobacterium daeguense TaxID=412438 RepID=UPI00041140F7|nr:hypothetical protein [Chryseobacterium daeguense]